MSCCAYNSYKLLEKYDTRNQASVNSTISQWGQKPLKLGLNPTGHMSFLTGQDRTPKFAGRVTPDRTKSRLTFLNILHAKQQNFNEIHQIESPASGKENGPDHR